MDPSGPAEVLPDTLRLLLETALDAVVVINGQGRVIGWNRVAEDTFGWAAADVIGQDMTRLIIPPQHRLAHEQGMRRFQQTGESNVLNRRIEITALNKQGAEFPVELSIVHTLAAGQSVFVGYLRDISARREQERALEIARDEAARLAAEQAAILSQLAEAVIVANKDGELAFVNEAAARLHGVAQLGIGPDEYSDTYHLLTMAGAPYPSHDLPLARAVRGETVLEERWKISRPDGSEVLAVGSAQPIVDGQGAQVGAVLTARDDTQRHEAERLVIENEARLRALTDNLPGGAVYQVATGADGGERRFLFMSQSFERLSGFPAEAVLADPMVAYGAVHPDDRQGLAQAELQAIASNSPFDMQARFVRADGQILWCHFISAPRKQMDGSLIWDGILIDATARITAENALREMNATLESEVAHRTAERNQVWEMSRDLLAVMGFDGFLKAINPAWETTLGFDQATLLAMSFREQVHPDDHAGVAAVVERLSRGETIPIFEDRLRHRDGSWRWIAWSLVPSGDVFYATGRDVTAEKQAAAELQAAHEALRQAQKMEAMGQLTGGVAHDFNNLLTPIVGALDMLQRNETGNEREQRLIAGAAQSADKAKTLVQRLLAFARRQPLQSTAVDIGELISGMADLLASTTGPQIKVSVHVPAKLPRAKADPNQLEMALLNLSVNARDAMPEGGTIRISAEVADAVDAEKLQMPAGDYVRLSVADTGAGMDEATLARAIEPFFSTKGVGKGTGLGLSMVHGLAAQLGGRLQIRSQPGVGTNIELWLPVSQDAPTSRKSQPDASEAPPHRGSVLLVDDDDLVRASTADMLIDLGYGVVQANSGEQALTIINEGFGPDLLVTDHLMPGMTGTELARQVRSDHPQVAVLLVSGYADIDGLAPDLPRLTKPFRQSELAAMLAELEPSGR